VTQGNVKDLSYYQCPACGRSAWQENLAFWKCTACAQSYPCVNGIPRLYLESALARQDRELRDRFYDGLLGTYYQRVMPFLSLPVRPAKTYLRGWVVYVLVVLVIILAFGNLIFLLSAPSPLHLSPTLFATVLLCLLNCYFFYRHPYLYYLILLAIPVKISTLLTRFKPSESFQNIHARALEDLSKRSGPLKVLDISTGTCNSLYRHGWMQLDAEYTGLDLSETMLLQGQLLMAHRNVPMNFVLADAAHLPFAGETFDVALNYGALNAYADPKLALDEMARVTKSGGLVLFLDEQLHNSASAVERLYFKKVLSSHNVIHRCPVELLPASLRDIKVRQVYQFYYICTAYKR
jgi:SAM-dependent methyltransferase/ribosomal protein L37AE/L43A